MQRNILATCPRVTRFRIDWNDSGEMATENGENQAPGFNIETESNQMGFGSSQPLKTIKEESNTLPPMQASMGEPNPPVLGEMGDSNKPVMVNGNSGNHMDFSSISKTAEPIVNNTAEQHTAMEM